MAGACFEEITGIKLLQLNLNIWIDEFMRTLRDKEEFRNLAISQKSIGYIEDVLRTGVDRAAEITDKILYLYLLENDKSFYKMVCDKLAYFDKRISDCDDTEVRMLTEEFVSSIMPMQLQELSNYIMRKKDIKIAESEIYAVSRRVVRFYISLIKRTRGRLLQPLCAYDRTDRRNGIQEAKFQRKRNGTTRHFDLQRFRNGKQVARNLRRRPYQLD